MWDLVTTLLAILDRISKALQSSNVTLLISQLSEWSTTASAVRETCTYIASKSIQLTILEVLRIAVLC